jgi:hypothetical protein
MSIVPLQDNKASNIYYKLVPSSSTVIMMSFTMLIYSVKMCLRGKTHARFRLSQKRPHCLSRICFEMTR